VSTTVPRTLPGDSHRIAERALRDAESFPTPQPGEGSGPAARIQEATREFVVIQDADLEYDPSEYPLLLAPLSMASGRGIRIPFYGKPAHRVLYFWHSVGNRLLTLFSNALTDLNLTDMEPATSFPREVIPVHSARGDRLRV